MSKAKHLHSILRTQGQLLHLQLQLHPSASSSSSTASSSLVSGGPGVSITTARLLPTRHLSTTSNGTIGSSNSSNPTNPISVINSGADAASRHRHHHILIGPVPSSASSHHTAHHHQSPPHHVQQNRGFHFSGSPLSSSAATLHHPSSDNKNDTATTGGNINGLHEADGSASSNDNGNSSWNPNHLSGGNGMNPSHTQGICADAIIHSQADSPASAYSSQGIVKESAKYSHKQYTSELPWIDPKTHASSPATLEASAAAAAAAAASAQPATSTGSHSIFDHQQQPFQKPRHNYIFSHGASGFAKHPSKVSSLTPEQERAYFSVQVGEDSYFRRHDALGVADGVGGWSGTTGANPALYSRKLMHYAFMELEKYDNIEEDAFYDYFNVNPVHILERSYEQAARDAKKEGLIGSSTACLAILRDDELRIANLGDCGISIIRHNEFIFRTEEQQHSFNYPFQLGTGSTDIPKDAQVFTVKVESGDIIVMGTDGIFDNLFDEDILEEVVRCVEGVDPTLVKSPYGTGNSVGAVAAMAQADMAAAGKPSPNSVAGTMPAVGATTISGKSAGIWRDITNGAAKLASSSSSTLAAAAAAAKASISAPAPAPHSIPVKELDNLDNLDELSNMDVAAIASSASAPSSSLHLAHGAAHPTTIAINSSSWGTSTSASGKTASIVYERKIPEPSVISEALAKRAKNVSEDSRHHGSPFQSRAMQEGLYYQGGKQDDMSVLVAIIKVAEDSPDRR